MSYPFISLNAKTDELKKHLRDVCGIDKNGTKQELIEAILAYEQANGLTRPTATHKGNAELSTPDTTSRNVDLPLAQQQKVRIKIAESKDDRGDVYVSINDWDALIQRNQEVDIPEAAYLLLNSAGDTEFEQNKDGSLTEKFVPRYHITFLGYAE